MSEISKYEAYKKKLQGVCDENNLVFRFRPDKYPITLTIKPVMGLDEQMSMLENVEENGYTSPDASIVFYFKDGGITYKTSQTFTINDALFSKVKNLFKNMHYCWLQYFFRDIIEKRVLNERTMPVIDDEDLPPDAEPLESYEDENGDEDDLDVEDAGTLPFENDEDGGEKTQAVSLDDPDIREATRIVRGENKASAGLLQRSMNIGYAKAARLLDNLEELGVVGPFNGSQPREVLPYDEPDDPDASDEEGAGDDEA